MFNTKLIVIFLLLGIVVLSSMSGQIGKEEAEIPLKIDKKKSLLAFEKVYSVLKHPRCMNCHPSGDVPLQGDDSHLHTMLPQRGLDGKGLYTMKCVTCHPSKGVPGDHTPPGNPDWHLPPADMKMVFEGKTAHELALQLVDPKKNGNKNLEALREHADDGLVKGVWTMEGNRTLPPLTHAEFKKAWFAWIDNGAFAPEK